MKKCIGPWLVRRKKGNPLSVFPELVSSFSSATLHHGRRWQVSPFFPLIVLLISLLLGFFKGTSADQDRRFSDKELKLLKSIKFPPQFDTKVFPFSFSSISLQTHFYSR